MKYYISFHVKKCTEAYEGRTRSPYVYPKHGKCTVPAKNKMFRKYEEIISKNCRINDMSKLINSDLLFPKNRSEYTKLLIELIEDSVDFFDAYSTMNAKHDIRILRQANYSINGNYPIIEAMLHSALHNTHSVDVKRQAETLKLNYIICNRLLKLTNEISKNLFITDAVEKLEIYLGRLRTVCTFIYLIVFKKKSSVVNKLIPVVSYKSFNMIVCEVCRQSEVGCMCIADRDAVLPSTPETVERSEDEFVFRYLKSIAQAEMQIPKRDSEESGVDTD